MRCRVISCLIFTFFSYFIAINYYLATIIFYQYSHDISSASISIIPAVSDDKNNLKTKIGCKQSSYIFRNYCCINQFTINYLKSIGFKHELKRTQSSKKQTRIASVTDPNNPLCYGLHIVSNAQLMSQQSSINGKKLLDLSTIYSKCKLHQTLQTFYTNKNKNKRESEIEAVPMPLTFRLDDDSERYELLNLLQLYPKKIWVLKTNKHNGLGIHIINDPSTIHKLFVYNANHIYNFKNANGMMCKNSTNLNTFKERYTIEDIEQMGFDPLIIGCTEVPQNLERKAANYTSHFAVVANRHKVIAQEFLINPLLINNRKFHIRAFFMIANAHPLVVLYAGGLLIRSTDDYNSTNIDENSGLITNRPPSKQSNGIFSTPNDDWTWSFSQFDAYLTQKQDTLPNMTTIVTNIKNIARNVFRSAKSVQNGENSGNSSGNHIRSRTYAYAFFAMDLLMTNEGKLKLMEIQNGPKSTFIPLINDCIKKDNITKNWACGMAKVLSKGTVDIAVKFAVANTLITNDDERNKNYEKILSKYQSNNRKNAYQLILFDK